MHVKKVVLIWAVREERDLDWFLEDIREKWLTSSNVEFVVKLFVTGESDGMLAAVGGVIFIGEAITMRLVASAAIVLGGVGLALVGREQVVHLGDTSPD